MNITTNTRGTYFRLHILDSGRMEVVELRQTDEVFYQAHRLSQTAYATRFEAEAVAIAAQSGEHYVPALGR